MTAKPSVALLECSTTCLQEAVSIMPFSWNFKNSGFLKGGEITFESSEFSYLVMVK